MFNFTPRVSRSYNDLSSAIVSLGSITRRILVCQHEADEEVNRDHIHALLYNTDVKEEAIKRRIKSITNMELKGNGDWSWVSKLPTVNREEFWSDADPIDAHEMEVFKYIRYIIKGDKANVRYVQNIPSTFIDKAAGDWQPKRVKLEKVLVFEKQKKIPYQQDVIAGAAALWAQYRKTNDLPDRKKVIEFVCDEMRRVNKGINPYLVKELAYAILYDDLDFREVVLDKIKYGF